jgi:hypothetical protein
MHDKIEEKLRFLSWRVETGGLMLKDLRAREVSLSQHLLRIISAIQVLDITPARKFRMLLHTNPTRERGECLGTRAGASEDM